MTSHNGMASGSGRPGRQRDRRRSHRGLARRRHCPPPAMTPGNRRPCDADDDGRASARHHPAGLRPGRRRRPALHPDPRGAGSAKPGLQPSNANKVAIQEALDKRPNQAPLIDALKSTIAYQRKIQAQAAAQQQQQRARPRLRHRRRTGALRPGRRHPRRAWRLVNQPCRSADAAVVDEKLLSILVCPHDRGPLCFSATSCSTTRGCAAATASRTASRCCSSTRRWR